MDTFYKFTGNIDRRYPRNEGDFNSPYLRENWLSRNGRISKPRGTERAINTTLTATPTWAGRYYSIETGIVSPKSFCYTIDGKIWLIDDIGRVASMVKDNLNVNARPQHQLFKVLNQTTMYLVDGQNLYKYDGNNDLIWEKVTLTDTDGNTINPIDIIEHQDRLWLISETYIFVSKNLQPEVFNDATDSIQIIIGSGKGKNLALGKIEDRLYILNTEGIFAVEGDTISAIASTFEVRKVDDRKIIAGGSAMLVEKAILFIADDLELWSFDGNSTTLLSYNEKLKDFINPIRTFLDKMTACYYDNYYMLSFVETGKTYNNLEVFWDAFENKIDFVRDRNISCYLTTDPTRETKYLQLGGSDDLGSGTYTIRWADRSARFDGNTITSLLWTKDIIIKKGWNVRFRKFYPVFEPIGDNDITIQYWLDGRLSPPTGYTSSFTQRLQGETKTLGFIKIKNQNQATDGVSPKILLSRGESITFYINDSTADLRCDFLGMGIDVILKAKKKRRIIGA